jgi:hypothetical protein
MKNRDEKRSKDQQRADALLDLTALMLLEQLRGCHACVREMIAKGETGWATKMMTTSAALAGALAKLKGKARQTITVERREKRQEGGRSQKSKNE